MSQFVLFTPGNTINIYIHKNTIIIFSFFFFFNDILVESAGKFKDFGNFKEMENSLLEMDSFE